LYFSPARYAHTRYAPPKNPFNFCATAFAVAVSQDAVVGDAVLQSVGFQLAAR
jgi:hypothetical protein